MTIKRLLIPLFFMLGVALFSMIALHLVQALKVRQEAQREISQVAVRISIVAVLEALYAERGATYVALMTGTPVDPALASNTDILIAEARRSLEASRLPAAPTGLSTLRFLSHAIGIARAGARASAAGESGGQRADTWFHVMSLQIDRLGALRMRLLARSIVSDPHLAPNFQLRTYLLALQDHIETNKPLLMAELANRPNVRPSVLLNIEHNRARSEVALENLDELLGSLDNRLESDVALLMTMLRVEFRRREADVVGALRAGHDVPPATIRRWEDSSAKAQAEIEAVRQKLTSSVRRHLNVQLSEATDELASWALAILLTVVTLGSVSFILAERIIRPVELMRDRMLRLAEGDLDVEIPDNRGLAEIDAMMDSLRVFRANGVRRARLQQEHLALHARLSETYRLMRDDLKAAALVQVSLLPNSRQHGDLRLASFFQPSHYLAGDTFDFAPRPGGGVVLFQIDVAGHGTAAALVSVVSHNAVKRAIEHWDGVSLAALAARINAGWPDSLTYFTLLLVEIDPSAARGRMVQAGHPHPFLLTGGRLVRLGDGGLPIGVLPEADYDEVAFDFAPGSRFLALTDGVMDLETADGTPFSEERLIEFLEARLDMPTEALLADMEKTLRDWHHQDTFKDDMTIVILEGGDTDAGPQA